MLGSNFRPFIPKNQGSIEKIIEEHSDADSADMEELHVNIPLSQSQKKNLSLDDTKNP